MDKTSTISSYNNMLFGIETAQSTSSADAVNQKKGAAKRNTEQYSNPRMQADTVSISEEARALFSRKLQFLKTEDEQANTVMNLKAEDQEPTGGEKIAAGERGMGGASPSVLSVNNGGDSGNDAPSTKDEDEKSGLGSASASGGKSGGSEGAGGPGSAEDIQARINEIAAQLQQLNSQLAGIINGPGSPVEKTQQAAPIQAKTQQLEGQLNELRNQLMQIEKAKA